MTTIKQGQLKTRMMMMITALLLCNFLGLTVNSSLAFTIPGSSRRVVVSTRRTGLFAVDDNGQDSDDSRISPHKKAIQEALEATKTFGSTSPEARVAWEIAEEIEDSIFSPCSKRCDPIVAPKKQETNDLPPLIIDEETQMTPRYL